MEERSCMGEIMKNGGGLPRFDAMNNMIMNVRRRPATEKGSLGVMSEECIIWEEEPYMVPMTERKGLEVLIIPCVDMYVITICGRIRIDYEYYYSGCDSSMVDTNDEMAEICMPGLFLTLRNGC